MAVRSIRLERLSDPQKLRRRIDSFWSLSGSRLDPETTSSSASSHRQASDPSAVHVQARLCQFSCSLACFNSSGIIESCEATALRYTTLRGKRCAPKDMWGKSGECGMADECGGSDDLGLLFGVACIQAHSEEACPHRVARNRQSDARRSFLKHIVHASSSYSSATPSPPRPFLS